MLKTASRTISGLFAVLILIGSQSLAIAEPTNEKLGDLSQEDYDAYCASHMNLTSGKITARLADTHVICQAEIIGHGASESEAKADASTSANAGGLQGSISAGYQTDGQWEATFTSGQNSYHLTDWCRKKYAPNLYLFNPFNGEGRIFVGDGGHACYKTVNH